MLIITSTLDAADDLTFNNSPSCITTFWSPPTKTTVDPAGMGIVVPSDTSLVVLSIVADKAKSTSTELPVTLETDNPITVETVSGVVLGSA